MARQGCAAEETAQSLRIPVDEVKAIILQATPRHHSRNAPNSSNPGTRRKNPPASVTIEKVSKPLKNKPFPTHPPRRERLRESKSPHLLAEARVVQQASIAPAKGRG